MSDGTIDNLNIQIEADAEKASQSLNELSNSLIKLKKQLNIDTGNLSDISKNANELNKSLRDAVKPLSQLKKDLSDKKVKIELDAKDLESSVEELRKKFKNAGLNFKFSGNASEFQKEIQKTEKQLDRLFEKEEKALATGVNPNTRGFQSLEYDISSATNKLDILREGLRKFQSEASKPFTISRMGDMSKDADALQYEVDRDEESGNIPFQTYDSKNIQDFIDNYSNGLNEVVQKGKIARLTTEEFEAALENLKAPEIDGTNIRKLESELNRLEQRIKDLTTRQENSVKLGADIDSDGMRRMSQQIVEASLRADALKDRISQLESESTQILSPWKKFQATLRQISSNIKKVFSAFGNIGKEIKKLISLGSKFSKIFSGSNKKSGFGIGNMVGMSVLYSGVFQAISAIQNSIKEGSDSLAQYSDEYNRSISSMSTSLLYLRNSWAAAFSPIVSVVAPYISAFVDMIATALNSLGRLISALTGKNFAVQSKKSWNDYAASLEGVESGSEDAADATKDLEEQLTLLPFDQINKLSEATNKDNGTGGGGGGSDNAGLSPSDMFETVAVEPISFDSWGEAFNSFLDHLLNSGIPALQKTLNSAANVVNTFAANLYEMFTFPGVLEKVQLLGQEIALAFNNFVNLIDWETIGGALGAGLNLALQFLVNFIYTFDWLNLGASLATMLNSAIAEIDWYAFGQLLWSKFKIGIETFAGFLLNLDMTEIAQSASRIVMGFVDSISETLLAIDWQGIGNQIATFIASIDYAGVAESLFGGLGVALGSLGEFILGLVENAWNSVVTWWKDTAFEDGKFTIEGLLNGILEALANIGTWIYDHIFSPFIGGIAKAFGFGSENESMAEVGKNVIKGFINGITGMLEDLWDNITNVADNVVGWFKEKLGINSPSTVFYGFGSNTIQGYINGANAEEGNLKSSMSQIADNTTGSFYGIDSQFSSIGYSAVSGLNTGIASGSQMAIEQLSALLNSMVSMFDTVPETFGSVGVKIAQSISSGIGTAQESVNLSMQISGTYAATAFVSGFNSMDISGILKKFLNAIESGVSGMPKIFNKIFSDSKNQIQNIFNGVDKWFAQKWNSIEKTYSYVPSFFKNVFSNAYRSTTTTWNPINSWFSSKWNSIKNVFSPSVVNSFKNWFQTAYKNVQSAWNPANTWFSQKWTSIKNVFKDVNSYFSSGFRTAYNSVTNIWSGLGNFFKRVAQNAFNPIKKLVNGIISGVNWVLKEVDSGTRVSSWGGVAFAKGSDGVPRNTLGVVNDQKGATYKELIVPPNGKPFVPKGRNVMLPLQKGTKIMPAKQTKEFMKSLGIPHFAGGVGDLMGWNTRFSGDVFDYLDRPDAITKIAFDKFSDISNMVGMWRDMAKGIVGAVFDGTSNFINKVFEKIVPKVDYNPSAGVEQWRSLAKYALQLTGQYTEANLDRLLMQMQTESGGNPNAINNWDINAKNGTPSKGLMQVIDPTFRAYAYPGYDKNIYDPLSNILAAIRYTLSRYGSLANGWKGHGYSEGIGTITMADLFGSIPKLAGGGMVMPGQLFVANERGPELVGRYGNRTAVMNNDQITASVSDGVADGVYRAMMSAMQNNRSSGSGDMHITIDIGGEKFVSKVVSQYNKMKKGDPNFGFVV